jgi:hypothetical protein
MHMMTPQILLVRMTSSGYSVWREDDITVQARFSTMQRARIYLDQLAQREDGEVVEDQLQLDNDLYQIIQLDLDDVPMDPQD